MAQKEFNTARVRNLNDKEQGKNWINAMMLYKATGDKKVILQAAITGADKYIQQRISTPQMAFNDPLQGSYFSGQHLPGRWIEFLQLYELTGDQKYLEAAHEGARNYCQFTWMCPRIPDSLVTGEQRW